MKASLSDIVKKGTFFSISEQDLSPSSNQLCWFERKAHASDIWGAAVFLEESRAIWFSLYFLAPT